MYLSKTFMSSSKNNAWLTKFTEGNFSNLLNDIIEPALIKDYENLLGEYSNKILYRQININHDKKEIVVITVWDSKVSYNSFNLALDEEKYINKFNTNLIDVTKNCNEISVDEYHKLLLS
jgi:hypothetical protein